MVLKNVVEVMMES